MLLKDYVNDLKIKDDELIYVGCESGWFFIGTKKEFNKDISMVTEKYRRRYENAFNNAKKDIEGTRIRLPEFKEDISDEAWELNCKFEAIKLYKSIEMKFDKYYRTKNRHLTFTDFETREVVDSYKKDIYPGTAIIVKGKDSGDYWTREEYLGLVKVREEDEED